MHLLDESQAIVSVSAPLSLLQDTIQSQDALDEVDRMCGCTAFACLTFELLFGSETHGILFLATFLILMIAIWLALEFWTHNYIARNGQLTQISKDTEQGDQP